MNPRDTAIQHLTTIITRWPDLQDALTARQNTGWPPAMGITALTRDPDDLDQALADRATDHEAAQLGRQLGTRPVPLSLDVFDVMRDVENILVGFTDTVASNIQRPAYTAATGRGWADDTHRQILLLATRDAADTRRWRYTGQRTATYAAGWLRARLTNPDGPFRPLTDSDTGHIATVAAGAMQRVARALREHREVRQLDRPCPHCRGVLELHGGDGGEPAVECTSCGWKHAANAA